MGRLAPLLLLALLLGACARSGQPAAPAPPDFSVFPAPWEGTWTGPLEIYAGPGEPAQRATMTLVIAPAEPEGEWGWTIQYEGQPPREYVLREVDRGEGRYVVDERNSIVLPARLVGSRLVSRFSVMGSDLQASYEFGGESIVFEIVTTRVEGVDTGGEGDVPAVVAHRVLGSQRAVLRRAP